MTIRDRVLAVLRGERPDRMPWMVDLSWWHACHSGGAGDYTGECAAADIDERYLGFGGYVQLHRELGSGLYPWIEDVFEPYFEGDEIDYSRTQEGDTVREQWKTPLGAITGIWRYIQYSTAHVKYPVESPDELKILRFIMERTRHRPQSGNYAKLRAVETEIGELGLPVPTFPSAPLAQLYTNWIGITNTVYAIADTPEEVALTVDAIAASNEEGFRVCLDSPAMLFSFNDNVSGETSGRFFDSYSLPYYQAKAKEVHKAGKFCYLHTDGSLRGLLPKVARTGVDAAEAVTPQPVGDLAIEDLRSGVGDRLILWGGVPGAMFSRPFTWPDVEKHVRRVVEVHKPLGRFVLGVADLVPPDGDVSFVRRISELMDEIG